MTMEIRYFKRYRMELGISTGTPPVPQLPSDFFWLPWDNQLLTRHADVKAEAFHGELDTEVFPSLATPVGCMRLMQTICANKGFIPGATWLLARGPVYCGTIQGMRDRWGAGAIQNVGVIPSFRGRGLGAALVLKALEGMRWVGIKTASLEVTAENSSAIRLYRRLGFRCRRTTYKAVETPLLFADAVPGG